MNHIAFDYVCDFEDEIALEGLDGITLQGLWLRLSLRTNFTKSFQLDEDGKSFLWSCISKHSSIYVYYLPKPRPPLKIFNRYDYMDTEFGIVLEPKEDFVDIYPFHPVEDEGTGIRGSCEAYYTRKDLTQQGSMLSYEDVTNKYGNSLVLVASQELRDKCLCIHEHVDKFYNLSLIQYVLLERIGRSRTMGEITQGKNSLAALNIGAKSMFYFRKRLLKLNLLTKQTHRQRSLKGVLCVSSLLHLRRFYVERRSKFIIMIQRAIEVLNETENRPCSFIEMKEQLGLPFTSSKKLFKNSEFQRFIKMVDVPYRQIYANAEEKDWKFKSKNQEKILKCLVLINTESKPDDVISLEETFDEDIEEDDEAYSGILDQSNVIYGCSLLRQVYKVIEDSGPEGVSQLHIAKRSGLTRLDSRSVCRNLQRRRVVHSVMKDSGRQRVSLYVSNKYARTGNLSQEFQRERLKMISMIEKSDKFDPTLSPEDAKPNQASSLSQDLDPGSSCSARPIDVALNVTSIAGLVASNEIIPIDSHDSDDVSAEAIFAVKDSQNETTLNDNNSSIPAWLEEFPMEYNGNKKNCQQVTARLIKRANFVIEEIKKQKVIDDLNKLHKMILEAEAEEGHEVRMDRKSVNRLLDRLSASGFVKRFQVRLRLGNLTRSVKFVVDASVAMDSPLLKTFIEQHRIKMRLAMCNKTKTEDRLEPEEGTNVVLHAASAPSGVDGDSVGASMSELKKMHAPSESKISHELSSYEKQETMKGSSVGPKFIRLNELHKLLFYLVYEYTGSEILDQEEAWTAILKENSDASLASEAITDIPRIYCAELSWKMFLPPLPNHVREHRPGWIFVVDLLLRLPLCIFVRILNMKAYADVISPFLNHPLKQFMLIKDIPYNVRKLLLRGRKYIFHTVELINKLCYIGLSQYGQQMTKERDQVFIYLNRNAILVDTTVSGPGYHQITMDKEYMKKQHSFHCMQDVTQFWYDMWTICLHTPLGGHACVEGKRITMQILEKKPQIIESLKGRSMTEASERDIGYIAGDGRGAAGLDSAMFSHLKRNWVYAPSHAINRQQTVSLDRVESLKGTTALDSHAYSSYLKNTTKPEIASSPRRLVGLRNARLSLFKPNKNQPEHQATAEAPTAEVVKKSSAKQKGKSKASQLPTRKKGRPKGSTFMREFKCRKKPVRKPYYDEEDRAALRRMKKLRVDWSSAEDSFLLLCKVASCFLYPSQRGQVIGFPIIRTLLHKRFPESSNKTSRACQRRIAYILKNPTTEDNVAIFLEEIRLDPDICQRFSNRKFPFKNSKFEESHKIIFGEMVETLISKFGARNMRKCLELPDSLTEFEATFEMIKASSSLKVGPKVDEVSTLNDIDYYVVYALLYSSMCTVQDRESWAYQLYMVYQKYSQRLLNSVLTALRESRMISYKKRYSRSTNIRTCLPLSTFPFQLSITFINIFKQKYQYEIFDECWHMTNKLLNLKRQTLLAEAEEPREASASKDLSVDPGVTIVEKDEKNSSTFTTRFKKRKLPSNSPQPAKKKRLEDNKEVSTTESDAQSAFQDEENSCHGVPIIINQEGGYCSAIVSLMATKRIGFDIVIPEHMIVVSEEALPHTTLNKSLEQRVKDHEMLSGREISLPEELTKMSCSPLGDRVYSDGFDTIGTAIVSSKDCQNDHQSSRKRRISGNEPAAKTFRANQDDFDFEDSKDNNDDTSESASEKPKITSKPKAKGSRLALYLMREQMPLSLTPKGFIKLQDTMLINACDISCWLRLPHVANCAATTTTAAATLDDLIKVYLPLCREDMEKALNVRKRVVLPSAASLSDVTEKMLEKETPEFVDLAQRIFKFIESTKEIGASAQMIKSEFEASDTECMRAVRALEDHDAIWKVGVATFRWISLHYSRHWSVQTNKIPRSVMKCLEATRIHGVYEVNIKTLKDEITVPIPLPRATTNQELKVSTIEDEEIKETVEEEKTKEPRKLDSEPLESTCKKSSTNKESASSVATRRSGRNRTKTQPEDKDCESNSMRLSNVRTSKSLYNRKSRGGNFETTESMDAEKAAAEFEPSNSYEEIDVVVRPWVRLNGCLNRRVMDRFLGGVLTYIMGTPGLTAKNISAKFWPALQPAHTYELLETLLSLKCIKRFNLKKSHKVSLFSKPVVLDIEEVEEFDFADHYKFDAEMDAVLKFGAFISDKTYRFTFLAERNYH